MWLEVYLEMVAHVSASSSHSVASFAEASNAEVMGSNKCKRQVQFWFAKVVSSNLTWVLCLILKPITSELDVQTVRFWCEPREFLLHNLSTGRQFLFFLPDVILSQHPELDVHLLPAARPEVSVKM